MKSINYFTGQGASVVFLGAYFGWATSPALAGQVSLERRSISNLDHDHADELFARSDGGILGSAWHLSPTPCGVPADDLGLQDLG